MDSSASSVPREPRTGTDILDRNNNKPVDLSRTIRLSGLSSGAKLELVQASKSPSVVSVALNLPPEDAQGAVNPRLTDKFPSTTTLWQVLRRFEAGVAGGESRIRNLTARGIPKMDDGSANQGRLYYQTPVLQMMGRELSSFTDLQKTLGQLGYNSGSVLLRLSFKTTDTPLEEAAGQIEEYFKSTDGTSQESIKKETEPEDTKMASPDPGPSIPREEPPETPTLDPVAPTEPNSAISSATMAMNGTTPTQETPTKEPSIISSSGRPLQVFLPPTSTTPTAARNAHNPADYNPTVEHAHSHQRMLSESSRNKRLPTEAEIEAAAAAEKERLAQIKDVEIKIRFPDECAISTRFGQEDTGATLYKSVRDCLDDRLKSEPFILRNPGVRGKNEVVPDAERRLIQDLGLRGRVLVVFGWDDAKASMEARGSRQVLKPELREAARPIKVEEVKLADDPDDRGIRVNRLKENEGEGEDKGKKKGMPKWLKGLSKK